MADEAEELKIWIAIRADLGMPPGKIAVQAGHVCGGLMSYLESIKGDGNGHALRYRDYIAQGVNPKIAVRLDSEADLHRVREEAADAAIPCRPVRDAGRTVFPEPTWTAVAFGPARRSELPSFLRRLRLYE